ncbi:MAG: hypothetical protein KGI58_04000 [Patescibacteria group bacterium]|nr:hypothetical protein [Patescibacteria group bacterium]
MSQTIITKCDICKENGDRMPSWFSIERAPKGTEFVGNGLARTVYDDPKVDCIGWKRYEKWVDLCENHKSKIMIAIQKIVDKDRA